MTKLAAMVVVFLGTAPALAQVTDIPITADKLSRSRIGGNGSLLFESHDPNLPFPDSPPHLVTFVILPADCTGALAAADSVDGSVVYHPPPHERYVAVQKYPPVRHVKIVLARGKQSVRLRWQIRDNLGEAPHLYVPGPLGVTNVGILVHAPGEQAYWLCARFDATSILVDRHNRYLAKDALAPAACDIDCPSE